MAAAIRKVDLTVDTDLLKNTYLTGMELTSYASLPGPILLASGRAEEFGGFIYVVEGGDFTVTDPGVIAGDVYVYLQDSGTPTAVLSNTAPTFVPNLGGWYNGSDKAIATMELVSGPSFDNRLRLLNSSHVSTQNITASQNIKGLTVISDVLYAQSDFFLNSSFNGISGNTQALDLSPYLGTGWTDPNNNCWLFQMSGMALLSFQAQFAGGGSITDPIFQSLPSQFTPNSNQILLGNWLPTDTGAGITITTSGTIISGPLGVTGSGFMYCSGMYNLLA